MNTQKYNIIIDHQFQSCFKISQGYGEMSSEINVIVHCPRISYVSMLLKSFSWSGVWLCFASFFEAEGEAFID